MILERDPSLLTAYGSWFFIRTFSFRVNPFLRGNCAFKKILRLIMKPPLVYVYNFEVPVKHGKYTYDYGTVL